MTDVVINLEIKPEVIEEMEVAETPVLAETPEVSEAPAVNESLAPAALKSNEMDADAALQRE